MSTDSTQGAGPDAERDEIVRALADSGLDPRDIELYDEFRDVPDDDAEEIPWEEHAETERGYVPGRDDEDDQDRAAAPDHVSAESDRRLAEQTGGLPADVIH